MSQLLLDIEQPAYPRFDKLLGNANAELIFMLQQDHDPFLYIWGAQGTGKSHILKAWVGQAVYAGRSAVYIDATQHAFDEYTEHHDYIAIDRIDLLNMDDQAELFYLFNKIRNNGQGKLLLAAECPPSQLNVREDLRTRMAYCLVYEVKALSQEEKINALTNMAQARQLNIDPSIYHYLINNWRADLQSLLTIFDDLANYSLAQHKPITLPLLKNLLKQQDGDR